MILSINPILTLLELAFYLHIQPVYTYFFYTLFMGFPGNKNKIENVVSTVYP
jgi:hypothetical protein